MSPKRISIPVAVSLAVAAIATLGLVGIGAVVYRTALAHEIRDMRANVAERANDLAEDLGVHFLEGDRAQIERLMDRAMRDESVTRVTVWFSNDEVPYAVRARRPDGGIAATSPQGPLKADWTETRPVRAGWRILGELELNVTRGPIDQRLAVYRRTFWLYVLAFDIVLCGSLVLLFWRMVLRPLRLIEARAALVSHEENVAGMLTDPKLHGEFASLASSLERMLVLLQVRYGQLRRSESMLAGILHAMPQGVFWKNRVGVYLGCNDVFARTCGMGDPSKIIGRTDADLPWAGDLGEKYRGDDRAVLESARSELGIIEVLRYADGREGWVETSKVPLLDESGTVYGVLGIFTDITERKQMADALAGSQALLEAMVDSTDDLIWSVDANRFGLLAYNRAFKEKLVQQYGLELLLGTTPEEILPSERSALWLGYFRRALREGSFEFEYKQAGVETILHLAFKVMKRDGVPFGVAVFGKDITALRRAEQSISEAEQRYRRLVDSAFDGSLVHQDGLVRTITPSGAAMFGYTEGELIGRPMIDLVAPEVRGDVEAMMHGDRDKNFETVGLRRDGSRFFMAVSGRPCVHEGMAARIEAVRNITERKEAERLLRESEEKFAKAFENAPVMFAITDRESGAYLEVNQELLRISGFTREEMLQRGAVELGWISNEHRERLVAASKRTGRVVDLHVELHAKNGRKVIGLVHGESLTISGRTCLLTVTADITARFEAFEELRAREAYIRTVLERAPIGFAVQTLDTRERRFVSSRFEQICGIPPGAIQTAEEFYRTVFANPTQRDELWRRAQADIASGDPSRMCWENLEIVTGTGEVRYITATSIPLPEQNLLVSTVQDVTERVHTEAVVRRDEARLRSLAAILQFRGRNMAAFFMFALEEVLRFTDSKTGYIFFYDEARQRLEPAASSKSAPPSGIPSGGCGLAVSGIWGEPVRQRRAILTDDLADPTGAPPPGPRFRRFLRLPVFSGDQLVAVVGLAEKPKEYDAMDIEQLQLLMNAVWRVVEQRNAEQALRTSEERYRTLVETSFDWVWEVDTESRYTSSSPRVRDILGYEPAEVLGRTVLDLMGAPEAFRIGRLLSEITTRHEPISLLEMAMQHKDGRQRVLECSAVPMFTPDGTWLGYRGMARDITARRETEKSLKLHNAALENAANAVVITDRSGIIEWANPAFAALSGWTLAEAMGKNPRDLVKSDRHSPEFFRELWETILAGRPWRGEIVNRRKDGALRTEEMTITPVRDADGRISHFIAVKQDITERKSMEAQLLQAQRMEAIGTLAGGIAHDLNNILAPVLMVAGVIKNRLSNSHDREMMDMLQSEAQRGADIIKQLLVYSRGSARERGIVQARHVLKEMLAMMRETFPREIVVRSEVAEDLWPVYADQTQLHQVVMNLCVNARDAMPTGGQLALLASNVMVDADTPGVAGLKPGPYVLIAITDSGHGIAPEIMGRIFDPFFTTKPVGKGTGLGLSTVMGIVQNHGGRVAVESTAEHGSAFRVYLPRAASAESVSPVIGEWSGQSGQNELILVVDDERSIRETTRIALQQEGYQVKVAVNGKDAIELYQISAGEIRLVLTDIMMPELSGIGLIRFLRAHDPTLPIVAMSGLGEGEFSDELKELAVEDVLMKPCPLPTLLETLRRRLAC